MSRNENSKNTSRTRRKLEEDKAGDLFVDIPDATGEAKLRVSFRRNWYSPPYTDDGEIDLERAAEELSEELSGGILVVARYLENGALGYKTELPVDSKDELEHLLRTMRKLYVEGLRHENAVRRAGLEACRTKLAESDRRDSAPRLVRSERRKLPDRRMRERRGRSLLGRLWFRKDDRRLEEDRRSGKERRAA